jgi:hypothetical protein
MMIIETSIQKTFIIYQRTFIIEYQPFLAIWKPSMLDDNGAARAVLNDQ